MATRVGLRKGDISFGLKRMQDGTFLVESIDLRDDALSNALGYEKNELVNHSIEKLLAPDDNSWLKETLAEDAAIDLREALAKRPELVFRSKAGGEVRLTCRIQRDALEEDLLPRFLLIVRDEYHLFGGVFVALAEARSRESVDPETGLYAPSVFTNLAGVVQKQVIAGEISAVMAVIRINGFQRFRNAYGAEYATRLQRDAASYSQLCFRKTDFLASVSEDCIAAILLEADERNAAIPLNRLRAKILTALPQEPRDADKESVDGTIVYKMLGSESSPADVLERCMGELGLRHDASDQLITLRH